MDNKDSMIAANATTEGVPLVVHKQKTDDSYSAWPCAFAQFRSRFAHLTEDLDLLFRRPFALGGMM